MSQTLGESIMMKEEDIRKKVKLLRRFYTDSLTLVIVNALLILVWLVFDRDTSFWPKYVILVSAIALALKAYRMGILPLFSHHVSFLTPEWEEEKIKQLMGNQSSQHKVQLSRDRKS
jgi:hypothetical protein